MVCAVAGVIVYGALAAGIGVRRRQATICLGGRATYGGLSVSAPTPSMVFICHGFGCKYRDEVDLTRAGPRET